MKYLLVLILGLILGAVAYHQVDMRRTTLPVPAPTHAEQAPVAGIVPEKMQAPEIANMVAAGSAPLSMGASHPASAIEPLDAPAIAPAPTAAVVAPIAEAPSSAASPAAALLIPVQGKLGKDLTDTFTDARSQGRSHDAIDIMATAGTPVLAVADGQVEKLFDSQRGGLTVYQFEPSGKYAYYYAHLQRYADGLAEKQAIKRGQVIGYVGNTGNASPEAPHLHFAIFLLGPERRWWEGTAINPYPILTGKTAL